MVKKDEAESSRKNAKVEDDGKNERSKCLCLFLSQTFAKIGKYSISLNKNKITPIIPHHDIIQN